MSHTARRTTVLFVTKKALLATASLGILAAFSPASASDLLSFTTAGSLSGWSTTGAVSTKNATDTLSLNGTPFHLTPATGEYMAKISPFGSSLACNAATNCAAVDSVLGVTGGTLSALFNPLATQASKRATNFGVLTESVSLAAGSYTFYWSYAAGDYHPYNDGVLFAISGGGVQTVSVLASNGDGTNGGTGGGAQVDTVVVGDYGATQWASKTVTVATTGTYQVSFAAYNWGDADGSFIPTLYVGASAGTVTGGSSTPIDTNAAYYAISNIGTSVNPDFQGGTLRVDTTMATSTAFTVEAYSSNAIDSYGHTGVFTGVLSGAGGLTIKDTAGGGKVIFTGANTYSGGTTIAAGGTLQIGAGSTTGSVAGDITNNGTLAFNRSDSITYAGVVSGTGSLTQAGVGTLILTGANTYTGATTISAGTLQIGAGGTTGSIAGDITNNAALAFNRSDSITYASVVSGSGSLTQAGAGTLTLTSANTYTGGTTIVAGTLQIGNGGTTGSITGNIVDNASLIFNRSNSTTYSGVISGTGRLSVTGGGSLILTGTNTYSGTTSIAAGSTLQIGDGGTTGSIISDVANQGILAFNRSDTVTFNGTVTGDGTLVQNGTGKVIVTTNYTGKTIVNSGTLQIGNGNTSGTVAGNIVNNATVVYGQAATTTYSGVISGSGGVNVSGGGAVILNGTNTYTGPTTVSTGSLVIGDITHQNAVVSGNVTVNPTGIVGGYGTIGGNLTASGGVVSPGNSIGTLTVKGNYTQSAASTLAIELTPTANDQLVVTGTAQLGGTLSLSLAPGSYTTRSYTLLTASAINGTFATVSYTGANSAMVYGIAYKATEVDLAMTPQSSGQIYGDVITATLDTAVVLNRTTLDRLNSASNTGWSVWSTTLAGASHTSDDSGLATFNSQLWGVISGVDYGFASGPKLSAVFSYTHNQLGVHGENDKAGTNGYFFSLAGHYAAQPVTVDVTGFIQANDVDVTRADANAGTVLAQTHNLVGGGSVQIGYPLQEGDVLPFARLTVANFDGDAFSETGTLGLSVNAVTRTSVRGSWGVQVQHAFATENGTQIQPRFLIGLENEFGQRRRNLAMTFTGTAFDAPAPMPAAFSALLGAGVSAKLEQCLELSLESNARLSRNQQEGILSFGAKYRF